MDQVKKYASPGARMLSVEMWCELAKQGVMLPVRIQVTGNSMRPLIRRQRDWVTVFPVDRPLRAGDIVMFPAPVDPNVYVLHRVWKLNGNAVLTLGDACCLPDGWMPLSNVLGVALLIERAQRKIDPNRPFWRALAKMWMAAQPARIWAFRLAHLPRYVARKLFRG